MPRYRSIQTLASVSPQQPNQACKDALDQFGPVTPARPSRRQDQDLRPRLRVAIVTENFQIPITDGVTRTLARLLEHLQAEGHTAIVLGPATGTDIYAGAKIWGTVGIPLFCYPSLKLAFLRPAFINNLLKFRPDVIHFVDPVWLGAQTLPAVEHYLPNVPRVSSYHTNLATYTEMFGFGFLKKSMWKWNRYLHQKCRAVFCPSPSTLRMLRRQGIDNIKIWPRGVDVASFTPEHRSEEMRQSWLGKDRHKAVLLYVGRLSWEKNLRLLIEAFKTINQADAHLVLVGEGPARSEVEKQVAGLSVTFMGHLRGQALTTAYASADVFAFPSYSETFGQVVLEALASGLPVVGLRAEGVRDLVAHTRTGFLLDITMGSAEEYAHATAVNTPLLSFTSTPAFEPVHSSAPSPFALTPTKSPGSVTDFSLDTFGKDRGASASFDAKDSTSEPCAEIEGWKGNIDLGSSGNEFAEKLELAIASLNSDMRSGFNKNSSPITASRRPSLATSDMSLPEQPKFMPFEEQIVAYRNLLQSLIEDKYRRRQMSLAAREDAKRHTWHEAMESLVNGYHKVIKCKNVVPLGERGHGDTTQEAAMPGASQWLAPLARLKDKHRSRIEAAGEKLSTFVPQLRSRALGQDYHRLTINSTRDWSNALSYGRSGFESLGTAFGKAVASLYTLYVVWILMGICGHTS